MSNPQPRPLPLSAKFKDLGSKITKLKGLGKILEGGKPDATLKAALYYEQHWGNLWQMYREGYPNELVSRRLDEEMKGLEELFR